MGTTPSIGVARPHIQRFAPQSEPGANAVPDSVRHTLASNGVPLDRELREDMESRFGHDFSQVRVHTDWAAAQSARDVQAAAYTASNHVVFGSAQFDPGSPAGRHLLAHELAHVVQQGGRSGVLARSPAAKRQALGRGSPAKSAKRSQPVPAKNPFVIEYGPPNTGQMLKGDFLAVLKQGLIDGCNAELKPFGYTAKDCPFILRTIEHYAKLPASAMIGVVSKFGKVAPSASATAAIAGVIRNARVVARRLAQKRYPKLQSLAEDRNGLVTAQNPLSVQRQLGSGMTMPSDLRRRMEGAFGTDLGRVRFHYDGAAERLSADLGARAFTVGHHVAFNRGEYRPGTQAGDWMIAHELAHTIQQDGRQANRGSFDYRGLEVEADSAADAATARNREGAGTLHGSDLTVQRLPVVVAGAVELAEVGVVAAEVTAVSAEVTVTTEAVVVAAEVAPVAVEASIPVATAATEVAVADTAVATTAASTSSVTAATAVTAAAATTLSGDSGSVSRPDHDQDDEENSPCRGMAVGQRGGHTCHDQFAAMVSGVTREWGIETPEGWYVEFDAKDWGGTLYEIKTGYGRLLGTSPADREWREDIKAKFTKQSFEQTLVAERCGHPLVWVFNQKRVADFVQGFVQPPVIYRPFPCDIDR